MYDASLLCQCLEWTKQLTDRKQEVFVDIRIGNFKFTFDSKQTIQKHKSPSQIQRNIDRQSEFKRRFKKQSSDLDLEVTETEGKTFDVKEETVGKPFDVNEETKPKVKVKTTETQTVYTTAPFQDNESQTDNTNFHDRESQTEDDDYETGIGANEKGEIVPKPNENIVELKFSHDMKTWDDIKGHITENLNLKMIGNPWVANNGRHFRTVAFKTLKKDFEKWKIETLNWDSIARPVTFSRLFK